MSKLPIFYLFLQLSFTTCSDICQYCNCDRHTHTVICTGYNMLLRSITTPIWAQTLYFHHMSLRHLPHFSYGKNIKNLQINFCALSHIHPLSLSSLPNLERLHLADNLLTYLPSKCFFQLKKLRIVNLARNLIRDLNLINEMLPRDHILEQLTLEGNSVQKSSIGTRLPFARQLYLSHMNMLTVNDSTITFHPTAECSALETLCRSMHITMQQWSILHTLDLSSQQEFNVHSSFLRVISNITTLNLGEAKLPKSFPDWLQISSHVQHLSIPSTVISDTTHSWEWCGEYLEWLDISHTNLHTLTIPNHCRIRYLKATDNHLTKVSLFATSLETVFLERNELSSWIVPPSGFALNQLITLSVASNKIRYLPENALVYYPQLQHLDISQNALSSLSEQSFPTIGLQIRSINISHNKLSQFVHSILPSLLLLDLSDNALKGLDPQLLAGSPLLQYIYLRSNADLFSKCNRLSQCWITSLNQLENLIDIDLSDCNLEWQPNLSSFQALRNLNLSRNRLQSLDGTLLPHSLHYLDVSQNFIHRVFNVSHLKKGELRGMDISRNPLICDCTLLEINRWIPNDAYITSTNDIYYCFTGNWQYPLRNFVNNMGICFEEASSYPSKSLTVICLLFAIVLILIIFIFLTKRKTTQRSSYQAFTYKPLQTSDTRSVGL